MINIEMQHYFNDLSNLRLIQINATSIRLLCEPARKIEGSTSQSASTYLHAADDEIFQEAVMPPLDARRLARQAFSFTPFIRRHEYITLDCRHRSPSANFLCVCYFAAGSPMRRDGDRSAAKAGRCHDASIRRAFISSALQQLSMADISSPPYTFQPACFFTQCFTATR